MSSFVGLALLALLLSECGRLAITLARRLGDPLLAPALALCLVGAATFLVTEGLSLFHLLTRPGIIVAWSLVAVGSVLLLRRLHRPEPLPRQAWPSPRADVLAPALAVAAVALGTLVAALAVPPSNWDAMVYHDARIMQWLDHVSVDHYYTSIDRQLRMPPLASYFKLHLFVLVGSDVAFNVVQWCFFVVGAVVCGLAGFVLTRDGVGGALSALLAGTLPCAVLQSANSQNNMIAAAYMVSALLVLLALLRRPQAHRAAWILFGTCLGLGALVKGTNYVVATVLALGLLVVARAVPRRAVVVALAGLGIGSPSTFPTSPATVSTSATRSRTTRS